MDRVIFCEGNNRFFHCRGVRFLREKLNLILKYTNTFPNLTLVSNRYSSLPLVLSSARRRSLATWGYYGSSSSSVRCFYCHCLGKLDLVKDDTVKPVELHPTNVQCDFYHLALENDNFSSTECFICHENYRSTYSVLPCGHSGMCFRCLLSTEECPLCKAKSCAIVKTYHS